MPGLAESAQSSAGDTIWTFRLRNGVVFQDGETPFNSAAVQANATRWLTTRPAGRSCPTWSRSTRRAQGEVRFVLGAPTLVSRSGWRFPSSGSSRPRRSRPPRARALCPAPGADRHGRVRAPRPRRRPRAASAEHGVVGRFGEGRAGAGARPDRSEDHGGVEPSVGHAGRRGGATRRRARPGEADQAAPTPS